MNEIAYPHAVTRGLPNLSLELSLFRRHPHLSSGVCLAYGNGVNVGNQHFLFRCYGGHIYFKFSNTGTISSIICQYLFRISRVLASCNFYFNSWNYPSPPNMSCNEFPRVLHDWMSWRFGCFICSRLAAIALNGGVLSLKCLTRRPTATINKTH